MPKQTVSEFGPDFIDFLVKAGSELQVFEAETTQRAHYYVCRLRALRKAMLAEDHPLAPFVREVSLSYKDRTVRAEPHGRELRAYMARPAAATLGKSD